MKTTKFNYNSLDKVKSISFDAEVLEFWGERARIELSCMDANVAYFD